MVNAPNHEVVNEIANKMMENDIGYVSELRGALPPNEYGYVCDCKIE